MTVSSWMVSSICLVSGSADKPANVVVGLIGAVSSGWQVPAADHQIAKTNVVEPKNWLHIQPTPCNALGVNRAPRLGGCIAERARRAPSIATAT